MRGISQAQVNLAVGLMAPVVAAASWAGVRSEGRSVFFRGAVLAFGVHGISHLGGAVMARGYTTGLLTAPTVVIPYWRIARKVLRRKGLRDDDSRATLVAVTGLPLLGLVHLVVWRILGERALGERVEVGGSRIAPGVVCRTPVDADWR